MTSETESPPGGGKSALRRAARKRRAAAHRMAPATAPAALTHYVLEALSAFESDQGKTPVAAGYVAIRDEIDPFPALTALIDAGWQGALPVVVGDAQPLIFRRWSVGDPLAPDGFSVPAPLPEAAEVEPDVLLVPMLAFDRQGRRMGYGAGFYDRTLQALRRNHPVVAVGLAYADQEVDRVPTDAYDEPLDWVATERFAFCCRQR